MTKKALWKFVSCSTVSVFIVLLWISPLLAIDNSECMDCHGDNSLERSKSEGMKETLFLDSDKFKLSVHNINGITCIDCHSDIGELDYDQEVPHATSLNIVNCDGCHEAEGNAYQNSVHRKAGSKGITIPCHACHGYHYVTYLEPNSVFERENRFCLKCHEPQKFHDWLPQKETHFSYVECAVCHAPDAPRHIHLRLFDLVQNKFVSTKDLLDVLRTNVNDFASILDQDKDNIISVDEFEDYVILLRQRGIRGTFHGELLSELEPVIHHINRGEAKRECKACHMPTSPFFEAVYLILETDEGTLEHVSVERKVLETYFVSHFYALGGTRVRVLDKIGIALIGCGLVVVIVHLSTRIATLPQRRQREIEKKRETQA